MDIQKSDSYSLIVYISLIIAITAVGGSISLAVSKTTAEVLIATNRLPVSITSVEAKSMIDHLKTVLADCEDSYLTFRIRYQIGIIYFKAGMMEKSKASFVQIANDLKCPELVQVLSYNMIGQISRLEARNKEALESFDRVANLLEQQSSAGREHMSNLIFTKLWCLVLLSKAEIYELQKDYTTSITEYRYLLNALNKCTIKDMLNQYAPLAIDRMSQLYLRQGNINKYIKLTEELTEDYSEYCRTPLAKLELECIKFMKSISANLEFLKDGSFGAPAHVIAHFKDPRSGNSAESIVKEFDELCRKFQNTDEGILLQYHYAWLLDALGKKQKSKEKFARIFSTDIAYTSGQSQQKAIAEIVKEYAKIQYAIMAGEKADYGEALRVLSYFQINPDKSHISELAKSVTNGIRTLKREVPNNENK